MNSKLLVISSLLVGLLCQGCATTESPGYAANWVLYGQVESIEQRAEYVHGDPAGGAAAGAVIGGVLGTALGGRGFGTFVGAAEGAMIGANASQGSYVSPIFYVYVRFEDGSQRTFTYRHQPPPFRGGDYVVWTAQGLARR